MQILWRGSYGSGWIDFVDAGNFAPGATISHRLKRAYIKGKPPMWGFYDRIGLDGCRPPRISSPQGIIWADKSAAAHLSPERTTFACCKRSFRSRFASAGKSVRATACEMAAGRNTGLTKIVGFPALQALELPTMRAWKRRRGIDPTAAVRT